MALSLKHGWLYFLGEEDYQTGTRSHFVKIGITAGDRPVSERMDDHQTGNPRRIIELCSIRTPFVDNLETHLHHRFASSRVHGEWFGLNARGLAAAIDEANKVNDEMLAMAAKAKRAEDMSAKPSDGTTKKASDKARRLHAQYIAAESERARLKLEQSLIETELRRLTSDSAGISGITVQSMTDPSPRLDASALKAARPSLYQKFVNEKESFSKRFSITDKPTPAKAHKGLNKQLNKASERLATISSVKADGKRRSAPSKNLHAEWLLKHSEIAEFAFTASRLELEIKSICGTAEEVEGVCTWKRGNKVSESFDGAGFKKAHPRIWARFASIPNPQVRLVVHRYRPY
jgi:hypothetical protein